MRGDYHLLRRNTSNFIAPATGVCLYDILCFELFHSPHAVYLPLCWIRSMWDPPLEQGAPLSVPNAPLISFARRRSAWPSGYRKAEVQRGECNGDWTRTDTISSRSSGNRCTHWRPRSPEPPPRTI